MQIYFEMLSVFSTLMAFLFGTYTFKYLDDSFKLIFGSVICGLIVESLGGYMSIKGFNNSWLFNIYILVSTTLITAAGVIYLTIKIAKPIIISILVIWIVFWIIHLINSPIAHFANKAFLSGSVILVSLFILVLINLINTNRQITHNLPIYLLCIAVLLYYACNMPTIGLLDYLLEHYRLLAKNLYIINSSLSIAYYAILSYAFYLYIPKKSPDKTINNAAV